MYFYTRFHVSKYRCMLNTLNCNGQILSLYDPIIMGVININDDSFYKESRYINPSKLIIKVGEMLAEGASIIDLGAISSRPGAIAVSEQVEMYRLLPLIELLVDAYPDIILSIDTFRSEVAKKSIAAGAHIINDISAGDLDVNMIETAANLQVPYIMMHMQGKPDTMQNQPTYADVLMEIISYFSKKIKIATDIGINDMIIDPGFGFGKTLEHNYTILRHLDTFSIFDRPVLAGLSRKSMIYRPLEIGPDESLNGTTALHMIALQKGASILRVHDVKAANDCIKLHKLLN